MKVMRSQFPASGLTRSAASRSLLTNLAGTVLCGLLLTSVVIPLRAAEKTTDNQILEGKLIFIPGTGPVLQTPDKNYPLAGRNQYVFHTLEDKRLRNDKVRLEGKTRPDGNFQVNDLYTIHHGELYRIRYYCETCNIVALQPGRCVCCQQPTELQEIPLNKSDHKVLITH
jgi:hypothetical protein